MTYTQTTCSTVLCLHHNHRQQTPRTNPALPLGKPLSPLNPQAWQQNLNNGEVTLNGITASGSESVTSGQTLVWNRPPWIEPDSPQHFEVLFDDPICWQSTNPAAANPPGGGFLKTHSCAWCKSIPQRKPCPPVGPRHIWHRSLRQNSAGGSNLEANWNTPKIQKIYRAMAQTLPSTTPTKSSHPSALYRTRASVPCGPRSQMANLQRPWQR